MNITAFFAHAIVALCIVTGLVASSTGRTQKRRVASPREIENAIRAVLDAQVAAWNRGDIDAFMEGYSKSPSTRFASGGTVTRGWDVVYKRYKTNYDTRAKMGTLSFTELETTPLSATRALVFGRFTLTRETDTPTGLFTLLFERTDLGWRIVADHTSSA
jgi:ketosteroid isomerase-like protein